MFKKIPTGLFLLFMLFASLVRGQENFYGVKGAVSVTSEDKNTEIGRTVWFADVVIPTNRRVVSTESGNVVKVDDQLIQIIPLRPGSVSDPTKVFVEDEQRTILATYAQYELDYFQKSGIEVVEPKKEFATSGGRQWLVWYFRVGEGSKAKGNIRIQLNASTMVNGVVFSLNAPMRGDGDETKGMKIMDEMMKNFQVVAK